MLQIKLGLFDDHDIVREGFRQVLAPHSDILIDAEGRTGAEAAHAIRHAGLDVCLVDLSMPDMSGMDVLKQTRAGGSATAVLILSAYPEEQYGLNALKAGAAGFVSKTLATGQLVDAVRTAAAGRRFISPPLAELLAAGLTRDLDLPAHADLSEREFQVFSKLAAGGSVSEIADELCLSAKTISTYRARLLQKLRVSSNAELALYAAKHDLVS